MTSGYPGRDYYGRALRFLGGGSPVYGGRGGGAVKRSVAEVEQQQQLQQALFLRSVKQKTLQASPISPLSPVDFSVISPETAPSASSSFSQTLLRPPADISFSGAAPSTAPAKSSVVMQNRLQELEKQLLDDPDDDEAGASVNSAVTHTDWADVMQQLLSTSPPTQTAVAPSPTTSTSTASCSPSTMTTTISSRQLIADTAAAIAEGNKEVAASNIAVLKRAANPCGDPEQRLTAYMVGALLCRMSPSQLGGAHPAPELCTPEHFAAMQFLFDYSPVFKLCQSTANLAILDACKDYPRIHVIDFDIRNGAQYAFLVQALSERHNKTDHGPPSLHITVVCDPSSPFNTYNAGSGGAGCLKMIGEKLARLAERIGVGLRFNIVPRRQSELDRSSLECEQGEALAVNLAFVLSRVADESVSPANPRDELLRRVKALGPTVVTLAEQELNTNTAPLAARAAEACAHYGALFESLDRAAARDSRERMAVEACLGRKAANAVGRDGAKRIERCEVYGKWRARMGMAGFKPHPLRPSVVEPVRSKFDSLRSCQNASGFTIKDESGSLWFGWMGRPLTVASAWC